MNTQLQGNAQVSLDFLRWARPNGPWVLTAIPPEGGLTKTVTFSGEESDQLLTWVSEFNGRMNIYWMVNLNRAPLKSKAKKGDVEAMQFLHVDLDPTKPASNEPEVMARHMASERDRILSQLKSFQPQPSAIVDSGGGFQGFWRLKEPIQVGGQLTIAEEAEAYNQQLGVVLGGDNTHNCDRIMRLPGTINVPDEKKRRKGRVPRVAEVVYANDLAYPLSNFTPAPRIQVEGGHTTSIKISGNLAFIKDLDELGEKVSQRTRALIVQGDDPDDPTKYSSRSDVVWAVTCELVRAGCTDDQIAAVLLDPDFGISAHIRDQRRSADYAARQIQRAREEVESPLLRQMNEKHAVIADLGGKCRVVTEIVDDTLNRTRLSKQTFEDFRNRYMHIKVEVMKKDNQPTYMPLGKWWLLHEMRRQHETIVFAPRREIPGAYNLWQGFGCEAIPGDKHQLYLQHIHDNICGGNNDHFLYVVNWMARAVQRPAEQGEVAIVLRGGQGTGKGTFAWGFGSLWGRHFLHISTSKHLVGQFNAHLRDCVVLFADEAFFAGDKQHESTLKTLITENVLVIEGKGLDAEVAPNYTHLIMSSNSHWVVPAGPDERRYLMLDVSEAQKQNTRYFAEIREAMENGGRESLLHFLLNLDISNFNVRDVPKTQALKEQKMLNMNLEESWWHDRLMSGCTTATSDCWELNILKDRLLADYYRFADNLKVWRRLHPSAFGRFLSRMMPGQFPISVQRVTEVEEPDDQGRMVKKYPRRYWYTLPSLAECRAEFERQYNGELVPWPDEIEESEPAQSRSGGDEPY